MAIEYRIYRNDSAGGPVNLDAPVDTVAGLTWTSPVLPSGSDTTFLVRAYDTATGLEDPNTDARARVRLDALDEDVGGRPPPPLGLTARATAAGTALVNWVAAPGANAAGFRVYAWPASGPPDYATPAAAVACDPGNPARRYGATLAGLGAGTAYAVAVRAFNAGGEEANTATAAVTTPAGALAAVVPVAAAAAP